MLQHAPKARARPIVRRVRLRSRRGGCQRRNGQRGWVGCWSLSRRRIRLLRLLCGTRKRCWSSGKGCSASGAAGGSDGGGSGDCAIISGGEPRAPPFSPKSFSKSSPSLTTTFKLSSQTCCLLCSSPKRRRNHFSLSETIVMHSCTSECELEIGKGRRRGR